MVEGKAMHRYDKNTHSITIPVHNMKLLKQGWVRFMVFNATFNNILVISWQSVLLGGNHRPAASH